MRRVVLVVLAIALFCSAGALAEESIDADCRFEGIRLNGKVKVVTSFPDLEVEIVTSFPDLKVKAVESFADRCGEWEFVDSFPDFTIKYVESFPDLTIEMVESFPGLP